MRAWCIAGGKAKCCSPYKKQYGFSSTNYKWNYRMIPQFHLLQIQMDGQLGLGETRGHLCSLQRY